MEAFRLLIVTGMSGAGKTQVLQALEDMGYLCIDNIPPILIPKLSEICRQGGERTNRVALVVDIRGGEFFEALSSSLETLREMKVDYEIVFMDATDETLIRRYKENSSQPSTGSRWDDHYRFERGTSDIKFCTT